MNNSLCSISLRRALYRVFVSPAAAAPSYRHAPMSIHQQTRPYAKLRGFEASAAEFLEKDDPGFDKRYTTKQSFERSGKARLPIDHEITDPKIMVIDNGPPEGPLNTHFALTKIRPEESLRMMTPYVPGDRAKNRPVQYAVCKIVNKKQEVDAARERKERRKTEEKKPKSKEMELGWAITDHDLGFKMRTVQGFLEKGWKVTITVGKKKGMAKVDQERCREVVKMVEEEAGLTGSRIKPAEGEAGKTYRMFYKGKGKPAEAAPKEEKQKESPEDSTPTL